jgi:hypothetical protein
MVAVGKLDREAQPHYSTSPQLARAELGSAGRWTGVRPRDRES